METSKVDIKSTVNKQTLHCNSNTKTVPEDNVYIHKTNWKTITASTVKHFCKQYFPQNLDQKNTQNNSSQTVNRKKKLITNKWHKTNTKIAMSSLSPLQKQQS